MRAASRVSSARLALCLAAGLAAFLTAPPAFSAAASPADEEVQGVTVTVPGRFNRNVGTGAATDLVTLSRRVSYRGLDLSTPAGSKELDRRVREAANWACRQLEFMHPVGRPEQVTCTRIAVEDTQSQIQEAKTRVLTR